jgi:hypothetical protein
MADFKILSHVDLTKRGGQRLTTFLDKIANGDEFLTTKGLVVIEKDQHKMLSEVMGAKGFKATIRGKIKARRIVLEYPKDFLKSQEFGGRGIGGGTLKEDIELNSLQKQIKKIINDTGKPYVLVKHGTKNFKITDAESTPGTPKSDFHLLDEKGQEVIWISHKDGSTEKHFQQWGGISQRSEPTIHNHKETQSFIKDLKKSFPKGLPRATTLYRKIKSKNLKMWSVYGNDYGKKEGQQNTSILLQGPVKLKKVGRTYQLSATGVHLNGESIKGGFEPVFAAIYKPDRSDAGVKGTRIVIMPIGGRKMTGEF